IQEGREPAAVDPPRVALAWIPSETWFAARALPPGSTRSEAMLLALDEELAADRAARISTAEVQVREELAAADAAGAAALAARIDALEPTPARFELCAWSMAQAGRAAEYEPAWRARAAAAREGPDEARSHLVGARIALARGDELAARAALGAALALADPDAAILTARLLLASGEHRRARILARAWVEDETARGVPGALWALACLAETPGSASRGTPPGSGAPVR
ncbi:MAG: hypothetical protein NTY35_12840, partial [Planctomycetota bacterium]|nr:hypothetical protein [Planctomycetota bacterium]